MKEKYTAVILCGGKSKRMGFDKSKIKIGEKFLVEITAEKLENIFDEVVFVAENKYKFGNIKYTVLEDLKKEYGPAGGIFTGLNYSSSPYTFFIACDMPFVNLEYIKYMMNFTKEKNFHVIMAHNGKDIEPLYSFYSKDLVPYFKRGIDAGRLSIRKIIEGTNIKYIPETIKEKYDNSLGMFTNLNYKSDLDNIYGKYKQD
ncbi:molybdenum cofactor guanylyltransferase [Clostridium sp. AWRP]|uniref:molybdenum cofactor guanylyltransferase n=1 Tax=Clostridium sp. AWRP TaxID=2212991 RepID=UPI000FD95D0F|nr:molybdenum cofactor guanylyltransferase [Clostridium sp. AWRP]AZV57080.1 molybdenum cofactor guanylyltransferase [Clostridium sp. AWRP]